MNKALMSSYTCFFRKKFEFLKTKKTNAVILIPCQEGNLYVFGDK